MKEFRGKIVDNGEWVYGYFGIKGKGTDLEKHFIIVSELNASENPYFYFVDIEVVPETVGQYIGRKDKNGVKIYEGDILDAGIEYSGLYGMPVVEIGEYIDCELGDCKLIGANLAFEDDTQTGIISDTIGTFIVIGNIHDKEGGIKCIM